MFDALEAADPLFKDPKQRKHWLNHYLPALLMITVIVVNASLMLFALVVMLLCRGENLGKAKRKGHIRVEQSGDMLE